jgi:Domain of unknown function (DUF1707)
MANGDHLRIGDADREATAASLREHYAAGRLSLEEFNERIDAAFAATTQAQLRRITSDLPHAAVPRAPAPVTARQQWHDHGRQGYARRRLGFLSIVTTVLLTWFIYADLVSPDLRHLPGFGRIGILLAIFAVIRGILRRVIGWPRPGRRFGCGYQHSRWHN